MKEQWQKISLKIDALTLRERVMAFAGAAAVLITLVNMLLLDPLMSRQKQLTQQVQQEQQRIAAMQTEIQNMLRSHSGDPDALNRQRLRLLEEESGQLRAELKSMQKGLVSPDRMAALLEDLLRQNGRLRMTAMKTLPVALLNEPLQAADNTAVRDAQAVPDSEAAVDALYKHGVEIVVQGGYADILDYLAQLEAMPWQLFWANARLQAGTYPDATLTLTVYTLSLDKRWLHI